MLRFFISHPTASNLIMVIFLLAGVFYMPSLVKETFPHIDKNQLQIRVTYPGSSSSDVEKAICRPLDDAVTTLTSLKEAKCQSRSGVGIMTLEMQESGDFELFKDDVRTAVDGVDNFPEQAEIPIIEEIGRTESVITVAITVEESDALILKDLAETLKEEMLQDPLIPLVTIDGFSQRELRVRIDPHKIRQYGLSVNAIAQIVSDFNQDLPLGTLVTSQKEYDLSFADQQLKVDDLRQLKVISSAGGAQVTLGDIAEIDEYFSLPEQNTSFNGLPAAMLKIEKNTGQDSLKVLDAVKAFIGKKQQELPNTVNLQTTEDVTSIVIERLSMLVNNSIQGFLLVFLTLMMFFSLRYSFWVAMGLPVSFMASFFIMSIFGITINMMSLVALLLALGILMDDAIVISESIAAEFKKGLSPLEAAVSGTKRVARGVLSSFATTVFIFGSLLTLQGDLGQVLKAIPAVLLTVISVSLIEAFLILPSHLYHTMSSGQNSQLGPIRSKIEEAFESARFKLGQIVEVAIEYRRLVIGATIALFLISISLLPGGVLKFSALPKLEGDVLQARLTMPNGTPLAVTEEHTQKIITAMNEAASALEEREGENEDLIRQVSVTFGQNIDAFEEGPHLVTISADLLPSEQRKTVLDDFISVWLETLPVMPEIEGLVLTEPAVGPAGRPIEIRLKGVSLDKLDLAANDLEAWLQDYTGVYAVFSDLKQGKPEFSLSLKPEARVIGLTAHDIANQLRSAYYGVEVDSVYRGLDQIDIVVELQREPTQSINDFENFPIIHPKTGELIPLISLASVELKREFSQINRVDRVQAVTVYGSVNPLLANTKEVIADTEKRLLTKLKDKYNGLEYQIEGEIANSKETGASLGRGFLFGLIGVFVLLSLQFKTYSEPLIVMIAIPLSLIGVIWGHLLMGYNLSMPSLVGFVSLAGIVVNNSILLVEFVKHNCANGMDIHHAARQASQERLRAIVLTTTTTVAGMLPLMFESSLQAQVLIPLVISIAFGLLISSVLVLIVVPCLYMALNDIRS
ncbi:efflux RND transporter permease subunit [Vibrio sp. THAF190c]|uniref:efflux RND transporter permease subunit n=1 Tax=Vibrio sp. THAF190c TaxID=2587865 RepID=UPI0012679585|nr:efflux RND transporter permease subunit [Vibrio sp. THAF190c]QFT13090.1 Multidrug resistance protein MdtB [Vibrio sp. THAF190c]